MLVVIFLLEFFFQKEKLKTKILEIKWFQRFSIIKMKGGQNFQIFILAFQFVAKI